MAVELSIRGISSTSNRTTWTWSGWVKRTSINTTGFLFSGNNERTGGSNYTSISFSSNRLRFYNYYSGGAQDDLQTNALYRDTNGWYHIVVAYDSTQATESNRVKLYVNGEQITSFNTANYPAQNDGAFVNVSGNDHYIGTQTNSLNEAFGGSMAHIHFTDGTAYAASDFGETDSTTGIWKPKLSPSVTYGTNGFFLKFENTSDFGEDDSGQNNDFTVQQGTITQTIDTPSNVFATLNFNDFGLVGSDPVLANGNLTTMATTGASDYGIRSTLAVNKGKWYWEAKYTTGNCTGILPTDAKLIFDMFGSTPEPHLYGVQRYNDSSTNFFSNTTFTSQNTAAWGGITSGDIIGCALDMDNGKIFYSKNGNFRDLSGNTGDPANGTNPTFTIADTDKTYALYVELRSNNDNGTKMNFGNGYFGTDAVSSAGTNAGVGTFEYDVPSGFKALCTKNINAQEYS